MICFNAQINPSWAEWELLPLIPIRCVRIPRPFPSLLVAAAAVVVVLNQGWRGVSGTMKSFRLPVGRLLNSAKVLLESNVIVRRIASCFLPYVDADDDDGQRQKNKRRRRHWNNSPIVKFCHQGSVQSNLANVLVWVVGWLGSIRFGWKEDQHFPSSTCKCFRTVIILRLGRRSQQGMV